MVGSSPTFWRQQGRCQRGTVQFGGRQAPRGRSVGEEGCTTRHCCWPKRSWGGKSWLQWRWSSQGGTTWGRCRIAFRNKLRSSAHCWTARCSAPLCWFRTPGCTSSHTHTLLLQKPNSTVNKKVRKWMKEVSFSGLKSSGYIHFTYPLCRRRHRRRRRWRGRPPSHCSRRRLRAFVEWRKRRRRRGQMEMVGWPLGRNTKEERVGLVCTEGKKRNESDIYKES